MADKQHLSRAMETADDEAKLCRFSSFLGDLCVHNNVCVVKDEFGGWSLKAARNIEEGQELLRVASQCVRTWCFVRRSAAAEDQRSSTRAATSGSDQPGGPAGKKV